MPIRFPCTACGQLLGIATRKVGTEINCPTCGLAVIVPDEEQAKLLRKRSREERKQQFATADTPPEISIPRESNEAFDGGLESFLTQLDLGPTTTKPIAAATVTTFQAPPPAKPIPPNAPTAIVAHDSAAPIKASNGTHALPARPERPAVTSTSAPTKSTVPPVAAPKTPLPIADLAGEIPLVFEDNEVSVLSAADLLELADEASSQPASLPSAKVAVPPKQSATQAKPAVVAPSKSTAAPAKPPAAPVAKESVPPPAAKPAAVPQPAPMAVPAPTPILEIAPLAEIASPAVSDFGFDFSSPPAAAVKPRKAEPAAVPTVTVNTSPAAVPTAPFENAVWISRRAIYTHVAILVLVSIATFLIGWISGGAGGKIPGGSNAGPVRFEAHIQYVANGKTLPDDGAVVLLWPKQAKPLERLSSKRLSPSEPAPPADFPTLKALELLRGAYARTNAQGEIRDLLLTEPGEYYILVISRNLARPPMEPLNDKVIPILGDLFGGEAITLLGTRQFTLKSYMIAETRTLNHTFGAPAEK